MYEVDVIPQAVSQFFRSGMSAEVDFIQESRENVLLVPLEAIHKEGERAYVLVRQEQNKKPLEQDVVLGISDDKNIEILSGLDLDDRVVVTRKTFKLSKK